MGAAALTAAAVPERGKGYKRDDSGTDSVTAAATLVETSGESESTWDDTARIGDGEQRRAASAREGRQGQWSDEGNEATLANDESAMACGGAMCISKHVASANEACRLASRDATRERSARHARENGIK